jgi:xylulokinase
VASEAGALGAAIQALWCYQAQQADAIPLQTLTDAYVDLDRASRVQPDSAAVERYAEGYAAYLKLNDSLKGVNQ